jgi:hypothetical protein
LHGSAGIAQIPGYEHRELELVVHHVVILSGGREILEHGASEPQNAVGCLPPAAACRLEVASHQ